MCAALAAICKLISSDLINAVLPRTLELLNHHKELVRKKAVMALHRYLQLDPEREGPLSGVDLDRHLRQALCDKASTCMLLHGKCSYTENTAVQTSRCCCLLLPQASGKLVQQSGFRNIGRL